MNRFFRTTLTLALLAVTAASHAQDLHFSQFYEAPLFRNPAMAGLTKGDYRVQTVFRSQWNSVANAYRTAAASGEYKMPVGTGDNYMTLGLQFVSDKAGTTSLSTTQVLPAFNYHKSIGGARNTYLSLGFMGGLVQRSIDRSRMTTNSQYEGSGDGESNLKSGYSYFDGSVGLSLNSGFGADPSNNFIIGVARHHVNRPKQSFYDDASVDVSPRYVFSGALKFGVTENSAITFHADHTRQGTTQETMGGALYSLSVGGDYENPSLVLSAGAFMRLKDALVPTVKVDCRSLSLGLSYDVNTSPLRTSSYGRGGFELSVSYTGFLNRDNSSLNAVHCPRF
jgi:type IX secretion system PorP/SprF family membrane protein